MVELQLSPAELEALDVVLNDWGSGPMAGPWWSETNQAAYMSLLDKVRERR